MRGAEVRCEGPLWDRSDLWVGAGWVCAVRLALAKGSYFEGFRPSGSVAREFDCSDPSVRRKIVFPDCVNLMGKCQACTISRCDLHRSAICLIDMRLSLRTVSCRRARQTTARLPFFTTATLTTTSWNYRPRITSPSRRSRLSCRVRASAGTPLELMLIQPSTSADIARVYHLKSCDGFQSLRTGTAQWLAQTSG